MEQEHKHSVEDYSTNKELEKRIAILEGQVQELLTKNKLDYSFSD